MTYKPDYTIDLPNGKVNLLFNSWTFREYSNRIGIELDDMYQLILDGHAVKSKDLSTLLLIASESYAVFNDLPFAYTEKDVFMWIDELGGYRSGKFMDIFGVFVAKFLNLSPEQFKVLWQKAIETVTTQPEGKKENPKKKRSEAAKG